MILFKVLRYRRVLESTNGNKQAAAKILDIDRKTLSRIVARVAEGSAGNQSPPSDLG